MEDDSVTAIARNFAGSFAALELDFFLSHLDIYVFSVLVMGKEES